MQKLIKKYAKICHYIDFNIANMQIICKKYAKNMLNMQQKYATNMQNMHKSMYLHILHIYALPTLLMVCPPAAGGRRVPPTQQGAAVALGAEAGAESQPRLSVSGSVMAARDGTSEPESLIV